MLFAGGRPFAVRYPRRLLGMPRRSNIFSMNSDINEGEVLNNGGVISQKGVEKLNENSQASETVESMIPNCGSVF